MDNPLDHKSTENLYQIAIDHELSERHDFVYHSDNILSRSYPIQPETSPSLFLVGTETLNVYSMNNQQRPFTEILMPTSSLAAMCRVSTQCSGRW